MAAAKKPQLIHDEIPTVDSLNNSPLDDGIDVVDDDPFADFMGRGGDDPFEPRSRKRTKKVLGSVEPSPQPAPIEDDRARVNENDGAVTPTSQQPDNYDGPPPGHFLNAVGQSMWKKKEPTQPKEELSCLERTYNVLMVPSYSRLALAWSIIISLVVVTATVTYVISTQPRFDPRWFPEYGPIWTYTEAAYAIIFGIEWIARLLTHPSKKSFFLSPETYIDFLSAIIWPLTFALTIMEDPPKTVCFAPGVRMDCPSGNLGRDWCLGTNTTTCGSCPPTHPNSILCGDNNEAVSMLRLFSFIRMFRLTRLLKVLRIGHRSGLDIMADVVRRTKTLLFVPLLCVTVIALVMAAAVQAFERGTYIPSLGGYFIRSSECADLKSSYNCPDVESHLPSIPDAFWYSLVTITTVGYGDVWPQTPEGKMIASAFMFVALLAMAMPLAVLGNAFVEIMAEIDIVARGAEGVHQLDGENVKTWTKVMEILEELPTKKVNSEVSTMVMFRHALYKLIDRPNKLPAEIKELEPMDVVGLTNNPTPFVVTRMGESSAEAADRLSSHYNERPPATCRESMHRTVTNPFHSRFAYFFFSFNSLVVLLSIIAMIVQSIPEFSSDSDISLEDRRTITGASGSGSGTVAVVEEDRTLYRDLWLSVEAIFCGFFFLEWILYTISYSKGVKSYFREHTVYLMLSSILIFPVEYSISNPIYGRMVRPFRLLRLARVLRMVQLSNTVDGVLMLWYTVKSSARKLLVPLFFAWILVVVFSGLMYLAERGDYDPRSGYFLVHDETCLTAPGSVNNTRTCEKPITEFTSIPRTLWFSIVTLGTVGYGDMTPITMQGRVLGSLAVSLSALFITLPIAVVSASYQKSADEGMTAEKEVVYDRLEMANKECYTMERLVNWTGLFKGDGKFADKYRQAVAGLSQLQVPLLRGNLFSYVATEHYVTSFGWMDYYGIEDPTSLTYPTGAYQFDLRLMLVGCQDLVQADLLSPPDPFVEISLPGFEEQRSTTKTGRNPEYNEEFLFPGLDRIPNITFTVWDEDNVHEDFIGTGMLHIFSRVGRQTLQLNSRPHQRVYDDKMLQYYKAETWGVLEVVWEIVPQLVRPELKGRDGHGQRTELRNSAGQSTQGYTVEDDDTDSMTSIDIDATIAEIKVSKPGDRQTAVAFASVIDSVAEAEYSGSDDDDDEQQQKQPELQDNATGQDRRKSEVGQQESRPVTANSEAELLAKEWSEFTFKEQMYFLFGKPPKGRTWCYVIFVLSHVIPLIVISALVMETLPRYDWELQGFEHYKEVFDWIEIGCGVLMLIDLIINWHAFDPAEERSFVKKLFHPMTICDILSLIGTGFHFGAKPLYGEQIRLPKSFRVVKGFRMLRLVRVGNGVTGFEFIGGIFADSVLHLITPMFTIFVFIILTASVIYTVEKGRWDPVRNRYLQVDLYCEAMPRTLQGLWVCEDQVTKFSSIPQAMWWSVVTVTTVGYGDLYPNTWAGRFVAMFTMYMAAIFMGMTFAIISNNYTNAVNEIRGSMHEENDALEHLSGSSRESFRSAMKGLRVCLPYISHREGVYSLITWLQHMAEAVLTAEDVDRYHLVESSPMAAAKPVTIRPILCDAEFNVMEDGNLDDEREQTNVTCRQSLHRVLNDPRTLGGRIASIFISVIIILSLVVYISGTMQDYASYTEGSTGLYVEMGVTGFFVLETILRVFAHPQLGSYLKSAAFWVDVIAVVPGIVETATGLQGIENTFNEIEFIRLFRLFRLFKIPQALNVPAITFASALMKRTLFGAYKALIVPLVFLLVVVIVVSTVVYYVEDPAYDVFRNEYVTNDNLCESMPPYLMNPLEFPCKKIRSLLYSIPTCMWWALVTITTTGYGDVTPISTGGKVVACVTIVLGVLIMAMPIQIVSSRYTAALDELNTEVENRDEFARQIQVTKENLKVLREGGNRDDYTLRRIKGKVHFVPHTIYLHDIRPDVLQVMANNCVALENLQDEFQIKSPALYCIVRSFLVDLRALWTKQTFNMNMNRLVDEATVRITPQEGPMLKAKSSSMKFAPSEDGDDGYGQGNPEENDQMRVFSSTYFGDLADSGEEFGKYYM